ncbi:hypothetical protein OG874_02180 [Nocardia sp. NBC_00565]|uniref:hypothetical protein n=1 Tax=Nocardia sp. NBC_00565 TaxID=2975993 RepID=UPI002E81C156|nr:hypothetical protein [Nocardia sp. NBC_00565]WUC04045.1 hypothetical protein OG874_02180 [Nocardia sp. NBC_00565]
MTGVADFRANGLRLELATRRMRGPLVPGGRPRRWLGRAGLLAVGLIVLLLVAPTVWTLAIAVHTRPRIAVSCTVVAGAAVAFTLISRRRRPGRVRLVLRSIFAGIAALGLWFLGAALTGDGVWAYLRTLLWVVFGLTLLLAALVIAWWSRNARWLSAPLIIPFGISAFVSGVAFRLIFENLADRFGIDTVGWYRVWYAVMLGSAFLWTWLGFLTGLFRADIRAIEADPVRSGYLHGERKRLPVARLLELVRPVLLILGLVVGVAAARVFDVVLIGVPGSMQYQVDSATVQWWRLATDPDPDLGAGVAAAYALPLAVLVGFVAWLLQTGVRRHQVGWSASAIPTRVDHARPRIGPVRATGIALVSVFALIPILVLIAVCLDSPTGSGLSAITGMWHDQVFQHAWQTTFLVAGLATIVVVAAALPVAHRLASIRPDRMVARIAVVSLVVLSVLPAQSYLGSLDAFIDAFGLSGTRIPLIFVHAAAGLPIAILILRGAMLAPPNSPAADVLHGLASPGTIMRRLLESAGPAVVAVAVLEFIQVWNDFFIGLMMNGAGASPWSLLLWGEARQFNENAARLAAGSLLSAVLPVLLLLATWRRWLVPGLTGRALR